MYYLIVLTWKENDRPNKASNTSSWLSVSSVAIRVDCACMKLLDSKAHIPRWPTHLKEYQPEGTAKHKNNEHGSSKIVAQLSSQVKESLQTTSDHTQLVMQYQTIYEIST